MQEFLGSVRRSIVFRPLPDNQDYGINPLTGNLVEKLNSCIRKSRIFSKPSSPSLSMAPPIRYRKGELIGCGAFGHVYMGMNLDSGELLAVKQVLIAANGATREKAQAQVRELEEEVKLLKNLSHPNIVRYLGTDKEEETLNILLEFVPGGSISSLLGKFGPFPEAVIKTYTKQLLLGLEYLHNNGIMHRDIKGANILVDNKGCIKLADFGASKQVVELATISGAKSMKGTPYWMAPEVILQTGHSFSADIWSVGCTVIEMATGKPPWSQQYQEVAALFYIGSTKSHPEIPEHLSAEAKDFLLKCLQKEPNMRADASKLLQHPFVTGWHEGYEPVIHTPFMETSGIPLQSCSKVLETLQMPSVSCGTLDVCNLGSLSSSIDPNKLLESKDLWRTNNDDDMCQIDGDDFATTNSEVKISPVLIADDFKKSCDSMHETSGDWRHKFDEGIEPEQAGTRLDINQPVQRDSNLSFPSGASLSEDDDELTESKITAFLDEKALELKKLQTPLLEEFYNSLNAICSPNFAENSRDETPPNYLKLPPKSRSPSRAPVGTPSAATDAVSNGSPRSTIRCVPNAGNASDQSSEDNSSPQYQDNDHKGLIVNDPSESSSPSVSFSDRQKKWKEELDQELERKREMMRQAGVGSKTSSPKDRALNRQRERTRFASPGK
ncbi:mitogen-activated protein kinase kinase kinase ANP1 isoform X1 [Manihot esculenta]|uniref:mitogen-activated protein kinase kinase kinase n=1 Tax=Manihot esculenta TaxID=3983 RepID=A0A2C9VFN7_MANES|nr:mitogen-activated protein kinase kinase kinase ANP1 isoform X1 [Manihot esculenta]